ncbi:hypothetical protein [Methylobacterium sp. JK268]
MRFRPIVAALLALVSAQALALDARPSGGGDISVQGSPFDGVSLRNVLAALRPQVDDTAALKTSPTWFSSVRRNGFARPGDGGVMDYTWVPANCTAPDDGAQVQPAGRKGCWVADLAAPSMDVRVWGAEPGRTIDDALDRAIAWACTTHVPITIPYPRSGQPYLVARSHVIGNGAATRLSTCNNVTLQVTGAYEEASPGTSPPLALPFKYTGRADAVPFVAQGPAAGINLSGIGIDCSNVCATGIKIDNIMNGDFGRLTVHGHVGPAMVITTTQGNPWGGATEGSRFHDVWLVVPGPGGSGLQVGDDTCPANCNFAVISNIFDNITINWDSTHADAYGIKLGLATQDTFNRLRVTYDPVRGGNKGTPLKISPPPGNRVFPTDIVFRDVVFMGTVDPGPDAKGWAPFAANGISFERYNTNQSPFPVATVYGRYTGTDSQGNAYPGSAPWRPTDASGAGLALTVADATFIKRGRTCTVTFAIVFPVTAARNSAAIGGLPCAPASGATSRFGGALSYTDAGFSPSVLLSQDGQIQLYNAHGGGVGVASLSGKSIRGSFTFPTD